jgi:glycosyltransferase 2 family protein
VTEPPINVDPEAPQSAKSAKSNQVSQIGKRLAAVAFGLLFLWLAFKDCDVNQIWSYAKGASPVYLTLLCLCVIIGHLFRAWRWKILLRPLTERKISLWNCFCAVMIGYAVNIVIPRGGEVVRLLSLSKSEDLPWAGVLPTMFIDRLLDLAVLCLIFGTCIPVLPKALLDKMPFLTSGGALMIIGSLTMLVLLPRMADFINMILSIKKLRALLPQKSITLAESLAEQFKVGTKSLTDASTYPAIAALSLVIWFTYWLNCYLAILAFHLQSQVSLLQTYIVFAVGSLGVLIPSPGSVGSYHYFVSQGLILSAGVNKDEALAYATVLHIMAFVVAICIPAFICVVIQSNQTKKSAAAVK